MRSPIDRSRSSKQSKKSRTSAAWQESNSMALVMSPKDFATATPSWWCPGCGDFGVLAALKSACAELALNPKDVAFVSGIGCSGKISGCLHSYAFHGVHGRALPVATAVKLANRGLTVIAAGGAGAGY